MQKILSDLPVQRPLRASPLHLEPEPTADGSCDGATFFSCGASGCKATTVTQDQQLPNPVSRLAQDNSGVIVSFPAVPAQGEDNVTGVLTLGIGTRSNNQPDPNLTSCQVDRYSWFQVMFRGVKYPTMFDSGTTGFNLPSTVTDIPFCAASGSTSNPLLCPLNPVSLPIQLTDANGTACGSLSVDIRVFRKPRTPTE